MKRVHSAGRQLRLFRPRTRAGRETLRPPHRNERNRTTGEGGNRETHDFLPPFPLLAPVQTRLFVLTVVAASQRRSRSRFRLAQSLAETAPSRRETNVCSGRDNRGCSAVSLDRPRERPSFAGADNETRAGF